MAVWLLKAVCTEASNTHRKELWMSSDPKSLLKIQCNAVSIPFPTCKEQKSACKMAKERNQAILGQHSHIQGKPKPTVTQMRNLRNQEPFELGTNESLLGTGESLFLFDILFLM